MTKKHVNARKQRNRELAEIDAKNRCATCKLAIKAGDRRVTQVGANGNKSYCSEACAESGTA